LQSRGIYLDYMSDKLRKMVDCVEAGDTMDQSCQDDPPPDYITTPLEIIPFHDVQLTFLSCWKESPQNKPVDVTNEAIADNNSHSRGKAQKQTGEGQSTVTSEVHKGNLGLTGTDPVDLNYDADLRRKGPVCLRQKHFRNPRPEPGPHPGQHHFQHHRLQGLGRGHQLQRGAVQSHQYRLRLPGAIRRRAPIPDREQLLQEWGYPGGLH
jgi:hypothetical protein